MGQAEILEALVAKGGRARRMEIVEYIFPNTDIRTRGKWIGGEFRKLVRDGLIRSYQTPKKEKEYTNESIYEIVDMERVVRFLDGRNIHR